MENYFVSLWYFWSVLSNTYRWSESTFDIWFKLCLGFQNLHIRWHPLRDEDGDACDKFKNRQYATGTELTGKKRSAKWKYREKRRRRLHGNLYTTTDAQPNVEDKMYFDWWKILVIFLNKQNLWCKVLFKKPFKTNFSTHIHQRYRQAYVRFVT